MSLTTGNNLFYYSTQTWLAHIIARDFYGCIFYVYVSNVFDPRSQDSSSPKEIYRWHCQIFRDSEKGHPKYQTTVDALEQVALAKLTAGTISKEAYDDILWLINSHGTYYFKPLIYVIREDLVSSRVKQVPIRKRASPHSDEFYIEDLKPAEFDIISGLCEGSG